MSPAKFKSEVQTAYSRAIGSTNSWQHYTDQTYQLFDGITVFGRDAGVDLIQTLIGSILREAVEAAEAKKTSIQLRPGKTGTAALAGMVETLHELSGLPVTESNGVITLAWVKEEPEFL